MSISINQGDYVLYQDISVGNPTTRSWNFPGGTPTGSTGLNPIIRYLSPSGSGFNAKLTVTKATVSSTKEESNIIVVLPENISVALSTNVTVSSVHMGTTVIYTASGATGNLSYYAWNIAGLAGFTGTSQTQSSTLYSWINLTGSELGAAYSTYTSTSSVVFNSVLGNTSSSNTNVTYSKNGGFEPYNYLSNAYTLGVSYYNVIDTGIPLGLFGMAGSGNAYLVDTNNAAVLPINNTQFRAQGESTTYWSSSQDIEFLPALSGGFFGQYIASKSAFLALGVAPTGWESLSRYTQGNYMIPNDLLDYFFGVFYFADTGGYGKNLTNIRFWTPPQVEALIFNEVSIGYQTSRASELFDAALPAAYFMGLDGIGGFNPGGPCLPSANFIGTPIEIYLTLRYSTSGNITGIDPGLDVVIPVLVSSGSGNTPDGNLMVAQDTPGGVGIASLINNAIMTAGYDPYIVASASPDYSWLSNSGLYDISLFNGLKIAIIDRDTGPYLVAVDLSDNGPWIPYPYEGFPTSTGNITWLSFNTNRVANPYQTNYTDSIEPVRGWFFGNP
jgi:hypothetical protein